MSSTLFQPAAVTSAYLKMGLLGFQGSGKTKTATKTAIGLMAYMKQRGIAGAARPAYFLDTETGSDWVLPDFKAAGIPVAQAKTRAFADLLAAVTEAEAKGSVLIIDSVTHFWKELTESYARRKAADLKRPLYRLQLHDWGYLKGEQGWGRFADLFVNSNLHIILCGRAGYEFDLTLDDEGHKQLEKTGIKMKAESDFGYEPSLLVYMERHQQLEGAKVVRVWREGVVLKDRAGLIDGGTFEDPGFDDFRPHIERLNLGGRQLGVDTTRTSEHTIATDKKDWQPVQRRIVIDEIQTLLTLHYPSTGAEDRKNKLKAILAHFDATWTEIEEVMPLGQLRAGYDRLHRALEGQPSRYAGRPDDGALEIRGDALEIPAVLDRRPKTGSKTGNRTGRGAAAAE
jgi:AAA domain